MPTTLGLVIGESFAELSAYTKNKPAPFFNNRWYLPKRNLTEAINACLKEHSLTEGVFRVATRSVKRILSRSQGRPPAVLVTSGFETWLKLKQPLISPPFSVNGKRRELPIDDDRIFGISERVTCDGKVLTPITQEDLEFLSSKLDLLKAKEVAILFLHSNANSSNELKTGEYLRSRGFKVFMSHQTSAKNLEEKWRQTVENAFADAALSEEKEQIEGALKNGGNWQMEIWTSSGLMPWSEYSPDQVRGGLTRALIDSPQKEKQDLHVYCGLDEILILDQSIENTKASIAPTALIKNDIWHFPYFSRLASGFEPGPMMFGKSHLLSAIDVLHAREHLCAIDGFSNLASEKSRSRILETLFTLAKPATSNSKKRPPDAKEISKNLENTFIEHIAMNIGEYFSLKYESNIKSQKSRVQPPLVLLSGPLAESLAPLLSERKIDFKFKVNSQAGYFESAACASFYLEPS